MESGLLNSFSMARPKALGVFGLAVAVVALLVWAIGIDHNASATEQGGEHACIEAKPISDSHDICTQEVSSGYTAVVLTPVNGLSDTVLIDPGGPLITGPAAIEILTDLSESPDVDRSKLILLVSPDPEDLSLECRKAAPEKAASACGFDELSELYVSGYANAVEEILQSSDGPVDLLGASFASARWSQIFLAGEFPKLRNSVIVSPFNYGLRADELENRMHEAAHEIFAAVERSECSTSQCLSNIDLLNYECLTQPCALVADWAEKSGLTTEEVSIGLIGLAPLAEANGPLLLEAAKNDDPEELRKLLESGRDSALGLDSFGDRHKTNVHLLAGVCSTFEKGSATEQTIFWQDCSGTQGVNRTNRTVLIDDPEADLPNACFVGTQPDPILGLAVTEGSFFGDGHEAFLSEKKLFGHGDLTFGAALLNDVKQGSHKGCGNKNKTN